MLAFDGGSTKTDVVLVSRDGAVLGRARVGPSNHQLVGLEGTVQALTAAVAAVMADARIAGAPSPICPTGVYCLAGIDLPVDEDTLAPAIDALGWTERVILRNDTFAVSRAGTTSRWGIGVVCGTGMNCAAVGPDGRTVRFPALAELSGDFAPGGAWLGVRALGLALRAGDGRGGPTLLSERVPAHLGTPDAEAALTGIYTGAIPYARLFELGARPPRRRRRRRRARPARRRTRWPTRSRPSSARPSSGSTCRTRRSRSSWAGASSTPPTPPSTPGSQRASTPPRRVPFSSGSTPRRCWAPRSSASTPRTRQRAPPPRSARRCD